MSASRTIGEPQVRRLFSRSRARVQPDQHERLPFDPAPASGNEPAQPAGTSPAADIFTPSRPKLGRHRLIGRGPEYYRILGAILEDHAHVILHSERGRGKTSLINLVVKSLRRRDMAVARYACDAGSTYDSIMHGLMRDLPASMLAIPGDGARGRGCAAALPDGSLEPADIVGLPSRLSCPYLVCVVDELDRVRDQPSRTRLADTIKQLSDRGTRLLFVLVGTTDSVDQLLGEHPSIQRSMLVMSLPLLSDFWIGSLVKAGAAETGLNFSQGLLDGIVAASRGMPYMAQLLCLRLAQAAAARQGTDLAEQDLTAVARQLIQEAEPRVSALYGSLTRHGTDVAMIEALRIAATTEQDGFGRIRLNDADGAMRLGSRLLPPSCWRRIVDAGVLSLPGEDAAFASVADRALLNHVLLIGLSDGPETDLAPRSAALGVANSRI